MNIVLFEPEIPPNTGTIGRLCVATHSKLFLVGKLGFSIDDKQVRRAGLDYWKHVDLTRVDHFETFLEAIPREQLFFYSTKATAPYTQAAYVENSYLIFGKETTGLPADIHKKYSDRLFTIPQWGPVRSINLSNAASIVLYEALRQTRKF